MPPSLIVPSAYTRVNSPHKIHGGKKSFYTVQYLAHSKIHIQNANVQTGKYRPSSESRGLAGIGWSVFKSSL